MLHENQWVASTDRFIICGGNPHGDGGGVIGTRDRWEDAVELKIQAIKLNYTRVQIMTWRELDSSCAPDALEGN
jgi:hypothetical protein